MTMIERSASCDPWLQVFRPLVAGRGVRLAATGWARGAIITPAVTA
jgi:hypothetical protein